MQYILLFLGLSIFVLFLLIVFQFKVENEQRAFKISFIFAVLGALGFFIIGIYGNWSVQSFFLISLLFVSGVFLFPYRIKATKSVKIQKERYDERDVMFSRNELLPGSARFEEYYAKNPDKKPLDDKFRAKAGLLSPKASQYNPLSFTAADANFEVVENLVPFLPNNKHSQKPLFSDANDLSQFVKKWMRQIGAISVGITPLKPYHLYSVKGRREEYGNSVEQNHPYAVAFTVEMDREMIDRAPKGETIMESSQQYLRSGTMTAQLATFFRHLGYSARPHFDGNYQLIAGVVARDAGLGDYGRMGLLMTPELGPRVRIGVVTTNAPLVADDYQAMPSMIDFCVSCKKCADNCPSQAISFDFPKRESNFERWTINHEACFTYWNITGTDCGKCIQVCPYSHPDNLMHNVVRAGIQNSKLFSRVALKMDDLFYGRKVKPKSKSSVL